MVSVTMADDLSPPPYNPESGILVFPVGGAHPRLSAQIEAYYDANFRARQMETFAQMVLEKGHGAYTPNGVKRSDGTVVRETWQACGRRLFGDRFIPVMERAIARYIAAHGAPRAPYAPPAYVLEEVPEPEF